MSHPYGAFLVWTHLRILDVIILIITKTHMIHRQSQAAKQITTKPINKLKQPNQKGAPLYTIMPGKELFSVAGFNLQKQNLQHNPVSRPVKSQTTEHNHSHIKIHPNQQADTIKQRKSMEHNRRSTRHVNKLSTRTK